VLNSSTRKTKGLAFANGRENMSYETLDFAVAAGVATITLNRPENMNAMSPQMGAELHEAALAIDADPKIRAVVLTGAGKVFCAGGDLGEFAQAGEGARTLLMKMTGDLHLALSRLARNAAPVIAAVNGTAAGAGFSLLMAADLAIAAESAVMTMAYTNAGLSPDGSSTYYMPRKIGDRRARELMLTNRVLSAAEALDWGVVNQVVADDEVLSAATKLATKLANGPTQAFGQVKSLLDGSFDHSLETQMELEARAIAAMIDTADGQEGLHAFLHKRKPEFRG
jgi:2-(1,2-epoxy-1,2-dihydrophenyl)acetyl-CoA isomerase